MVYITMWDGTDGNGSFGISSVTQLCQLLSSICQKSKSALLSKGIF